MYRCCLLLRFFLILLLLALISVGINTSLFVHARNKKYYVSMFEASNRKGQTYTLSDVGDMCPDIESHITSMIFIVFVWLFSLIAMFAVTAMEFCICGYRRFLDILFLFTNLPGLFAGLALWVMGVAGLYLDLCPGVENFIDPPRTVAPTTEAPIATTTPTAAVLTTTAEITFAATTDNSTTTMADIGLNETAVDGESSSEFASTTEAPSGGGARLQFVPQGDVAGAWDVSVSSSAPSPAAAEGVEAESREQNNDKHDRRKTTANSFLHRVADLLNFPAVAAIVRGGGNDRGQSQGVGGGGDYHAGEPSIIGGDGERIQKGKAIVLKKRRRDVISSRRSDDNAPPSPSSAKANSGDTDADVHRYYLVDNSRNDSPTAKNEVNGAPHPHLLLNTNNSTTQPPPLVITPPPFNFRIAPKGRLFFTSPLKDDDLKLGGGVVIFILMWVIQFVFISLAKCGSNRSFFASSKGREIEAKEIADRKRKRERELNKLNTTGHL